MTVWTAAVGGVRWAASKRLVLRLSAAAIVVLQFAALAQAASRGIDYLLLPGDAPTAASLATVEKILTLNTSGWIFLLGAVFGFAGMLTRKIPLAAFSHSILATCYAIFAAGSLIEVYTRSGELFGWRTGTGWIVAAVTHLVFAVASEYGWRMDRAD